MALSVADHTHDNVQELNSAIVPETTTQKTVAFADTGDVTQVVTEPIVEYVNPFPEQTPTGVLERPIRLGLYTWADTDPIGLKTTLNVWDILASHPQNLNMLKFFRYLRSGVELSIRLNTNSFYAGALMISALPYPDGSNHADTIFQRAVLNPLIISAATQNSVTYVLPYYLPERWVVMTKGVGTLSSYPIPWYVYVDILAPLIATGDDMPSQISIEIFARFIGPTVAGNRLPTMPTTETARREKPQKQSGKLPKAKVNHKQMEMGAYQQKKPSTHRTKQIIVDNHGDAFNDALNSVDSAVTTSATQGIIPAAAATMTQIPILSGLVEGVAGVLSPIAPLLPYLPALIAALDKPENIGIFRTSPTPNMGVLSCDSPDPGIPLGLRLDSYLDTHPDNVPRGEYNTLLSYAAIPGICYNNAVSDLTGTIALDVMSSATPLSSAMRMHSLFRGSIKVMLQFFCSAFTSARFTFRVVFEGTSTNLPDSMLSRVIDVRGDTIDSFTVPYLAATDWVDSIPYSLEISLLTPIAYNSSIATPTIRMIAWIAAGSDFQFQLPCYISLGKEEPEKQSSPQNFFKTTFEPLVDDCYYSIDNRACTADNTVYFTDIMKRYYRTTGINFNLRTVPIGSSASPFELAKDCFHFQRGGLRFVDTGSNTETRPVSLTTTSGNVLAYVSEFEGARYYSLPFSGDVPFATTESISSYIGPKASGSSNTTYYMSVRDDFQLGFPVLPSWNSGA